VGRKDIEQIGYRYADLDAMLARYPIGRLQEGFHTTADGERYFFIPTPPPAFGPRAKNSTTAPAGLPRSRQGPS
jgi:hypothetical protein